MRRALPLALLALALGFTTAAGAARAQDSTCTYDRCALWLAHGYGATGVVQGMAQPTGVGFGTFVPGARPLADAKDSLVLRHYRASQRHYRRAAVFGGIAIAATLGTFAYYSPRQKHEWQPAAGIGLPLAVLAFGEVGGLDGVRAEDRLRRAIWLFNSGLRSDSGAATIDCPYDRCALRIQPRMSSRWIVRGADATPVARIGDKAPRLAPMFAAAGDSARVHYEAFAKAHDGTALVGRIVLGSLIGAGASYAAIKGKTGEGIAVGFLVVGYGVGHMSLGSLARARTELEQAVWFYNRSLPAGR